MHATYKSTYQRTRWFDWQPNKHIYADSLSDSSISDNAQGLSNGLSEKSNKLNLSDSRSAWPSRFCWHWRTNAVPMTASAPCTSVFFFQTVRSTTTVQYALNWLVNWLVDWLVNSWRNILPSYFVLSTNLKLILRVTTIIIQGHVAYNYIACDMSVRWQWPAYDYSNHTNVNSMQFVFARLLAIS